MALVCRDVAGITADLMTTTYHVCQRGVATFRQQQGPDAVGSHLRKSHGDPTLMSENLKEV